VNEAGGSYTSIGGGEANSADRSYSSIGGLKQINVQQTINKQQTSIIEDLHKQVSEQQAIIEELHEHNKKQDEQNNKQQQQIDKLNRMMTNFVARSS